MKKSEFPKPKHSLLSRNFHQISSKKKDLNVESRHMNFIQFQEENLNDPDKI